MKFVYISILACVLFCSPTNAQINILSGLEHEIYDEFANDIKNNTDVKISIKTTEGSVDNFNRLINDKNAHIAFVQSDVLLYKSLENNKIREHIKLFLPLYDEEIHVITRNNSKINQLSDLQGKTVGVGTTKSGTTITAEFIKTKTELSFTSVHIPYGESFKYLLLDSIDAFIFVGAAPSNFLLSQSADIKKWVKLIPLNHKKLDETYTKKTIPANTYPWADYDVTTYSVFSLLAVNTNHINETTDKQIEYLYTDLKESLKSIQKNKLSHPKWKQVDLSNTKGIDWPVYKQEYLTARFVFDVLAYIAVLLTLFQIYFIINKLWKRKHERVVAESISISAMFISIIINSFFGFKNIMSDGIPQLTANMMWIACSVLSTVIGVGFWVSAHQNKSFFKLLKQALKLEGSEAADLAKSFFRPSGADKILDILGQVALIDSNLDEKEKKFIQSFADSWNIEFSWDELKIRVQRFDKEHAFFNLRDSMSDYLKTSPPSAQASQLGDVLNLLVNIDDVITEEEEVILTELMGLIMKYLGTDKEVTLYTIAVVPQHPDQNALIKRDLPELKHSDVAGGLAYLSEPFYSHQYAEMICEQYRLLGFFSVVMNQKRTH